MSTAREYWTNSSGFLGYLKTLSLLEGLFSKIEREGTYQEYHMSQVPRELYNILNSSFLVPTPLSSPTGTYWASFATTWMDLEYYAYKIN